MSLSDAPVSKHALKSRAWKYFKVKDKHLKTAKCKFCQNLFSYRTSVTNLLKHVKKKHEKAYREYSSDKSENGEASAFSLSENEEDCNDDDSEDKVVKVLEPFESKNEEESVCLLCQETFTDQDSAEMMNHMVKVHNISQIKLVDGNVHLEQEESKPIQYNNLKRSRCWDYFIIKDKEEKMALCNLCDRELSFKSTVSNLIKHLKRKHNIVPKRDQDQYVTDSSEKLFYKPRSAVWSFFNCVNEDKTVCACVHCSKEFNIIGGLKDMKRHLLDKHPEALLHHKTNSDPLFITTIEDNDEGSEEEDLQEEYLDFDDLDMQDKVKYKPSFERQSSFERRASFEQSPSLERKPSFEQRSSFERRFNFERKSKRPQIYRSPVVTDNNVPTLTQAKVPDSLEHFSNYITSLLQELPDKISKKLQMNFVKQIIEAQIACVEIPNTKEETITRINSTVSGAVAKSDDSVTAEEWITGEAITTVSSDTVNSKEAVTVGNEIVIRPIVTAP